MANRRDYYFRQKVTEAELDAGFNDLESADRAMMADHGLIGVVSGLAVAQQASPNMTVTVSGGVAYDQSGQRIYVPSTQTVNCAVDENAINTAVATPGNSRILSIFAEFDRDLTDPRVDGNAATVYHSRAETYNLNVAMGAEAVSPTAPSLRPDQIHLADITIAFGATSIVTANIGTTRRQWLIKTTGFAIEVGTIEEAFQAVATALASGSAGLASHLADTTDAHDASAISNVAAGNIAATDVQAAINELDTEKAGLSLLNDFTNAMNRFKSITVGMNLDSSDAERETSRVFAVMSGTAGKKILLWTSSASSMGYIRMYASRGSSGSIPGLEITLNAYWDHVGGTWVSDVAAHSYKLALDARGGVTLPGLHVYRESNTTAGRTWADSTAGWTGYHILTFGALAATESSLVVLRNGIMSIFDTTAGATAHDSNIAKTGAPVANTLYAKTMTKAWARIETDGVGGVTVLEGFNIAATIVGGHVRLTFATPMSDVNFATTYGPEQYLHHRTINRLATRFDVQTTAILGDAAVDASISAMSFSVHVVGIQTT